MKRTIIASVIGGVLGAGLALAASGTPIQATWAAKPLAHDAVAKPYTPLFFEWLQLWFSVWHREAVPCDASPQVLAGVDTRTQVPMIWLFYTKGHKRTQATKDQWALWLVKLDVLKDRVAYWQTRGLDISLDGFQFVINNIEVRNFAAFRAFIQGELRKHL